MLLIVLAYLGGVLTILAVHPARAPVRVRARRPAVRPQRPAAARRHGAHVCRRRDARGRRRRLGRAGQPGRPLGRDRAARDLRPDLADAAPRGTPDAPARRRRQPAHRLRATRRPPGRPASSLLLGVATGLLWAPCAADPRPRADRGRARASVGTTLLLVAYAAGAATSLGVALVIGGKVFAAMKRSLGAGEWIKRGIGVALLAGVGAIALGLDTGALAQLSTVTTGGRRSSSTGSAGVRMAHRAHRRRWPRPATPPATRTAAR